MGKQPIEKTIDGETYLFFLLRPRISVPLLARISKIIGPTLGAAFPEKSMKISEIMDVDISIGNITKVFFEKLNPGEIQEIIDILFTQVSHKGKGPLSQENTYDDLFSGRLKHLAKVVGTSIEVQYADFFGEKSVMEGLLDKAKQDVIKPQATENNTIQEI